ncbi:15357_t:CDS:2 [Entrophospora sp. SA101]|nr:15355_t:CDS:2 [Entrophospora sp. SA101]CAJ0632242.1 15357_t:CDS:2 [Entrophospora sp. SA101]CAJ0853737.1 10251_t:CDS:2 [Entrophospora sp. SA101]CAJ0914807.1 1150_t:CDS:2 [Entrophospora sp. SA101]
MSKLAIKRLPSLSKIAETILDLRTGLGAAKLSSEIQKITLVYSINDKETRTFWRENLPRIAYNNPKVKINVESSLVSALSPDKSLIKMEYIWKDSEEICREFLNVTKAIPAVMTESSSRQKRAPLGDKKYNDEDIQYLID